MSSAENRSPTPVSDLTTVARQFSATMAASLAGAMFGFILTLVVTRGLGAEGAGIFFVTIAVFGICATVVTFGADVGAVRMIARHLALGERAAIRTTILAALVPVAVLSVVAAVVLFILAPTIGPLLARGSSSEEIAPVLRAVVVFLPIATVSGVILAATRGFGTITPFVVAEQLGIPLLRPLAVGIAIAINGTAIWVAGLAWAAPILVALLYLIFVLRRLVDPLPATGSLVGPSQRAAWEDFWRFASARGGASVFLVLVRWLDVILVASIASVRDAGIYAAASRLVLVGDLPQRAIIRVMGPRFSALLAMDERSRARALYRTSTTWLIGLSFPFYVTLAVYAPVVILVFGPEFESGARPLAILSIAMLVNMATGPATTILLMAGKASWNLGNSIGSLTINVALNVALIPAFGITGAAIAWSASVLFENLVPIWQIFRALDLHPLGAGAFATGCAAVIVYGLGGGLIEAISEPSLLALALVVVPVLTAIYVAILLPFRRFLDVEALRDSIRFRSRDRIATED
jgi:O-antigen/teichoic acid export membrane protein